MLTQEEQTSTVAQRESLGAFYWLGGTLPSQARKRYSVSLCAPYKASQTRRSSLAEQALFEEPPDLEDYRSGAN